MVICIDIGNTSLLIGFEIDRKIVQSFRLATNTNLTEDEYSVKFKDILQNSNYANEALDGVIIASVVPLMDPIIRKTFIKYYQIEPLFVEPGTKSGIHIRIENPKQLGADLLIGAVGAHQKYHETVIIVDLGTASKLFIVTKEGEMIGGIIAPGVIGSLSTLVASTAKLQQAPLVKPDHLIGKDTVSSIQSGVIYGTAAMIDGLIAKLIKEIGQAQVILTGGLGELFTGVLETPHIYEPNILLEGLVHIYYKNK